MLGIREKKGTKSVVPELRLSVLSCLPASTRLGSAQRVVSVQATQRCAQSFALLNGSESGFVRSHNSGFWGSTPTKKKILGLPWGTLRLPCLSMTWDFSVVALPTSQTFLLPSLLRLRFLLLRPAALPAIDPGLLFTRLGLRTRAHAAVPLAATTKVQRRDFAGCPGSGLCATGQANQIRGAGWATWQRLLITALVPSPTNGTAQRVILAPAPVLVRCRVAHGAYPQHRRSIAGAAGR